MFDNLQDQLQEVFDDLKGKGRLTEDDIRVAMRRVRMALLEADVSFKVVKGFISKASARCMEADVMDSLTPAQNVIKIVLEELTNLLGETDPYDYLVKIKEDGYATSSHYVQNVYNVIKRYNLTRFDD